MRKILFVLVFLVGWGLIGFAQDKDKDYVVATVGEEKIYFSRIMKDVQGLNSFLKENFNTSLAWRLDFITKQVAAQALAKQAQEEGVDKQPQVKLELEKARQNILANYMVEQRLAKISITEQELKNFYLQNISQYQTPEKIRVSYVCAKTKEEGEKIIAALGKGKSFDQAAGKKKVLVKDLVAKNNPVIEGANDVGPQTAEELFKLEAGKASSVIQAGKNFYVFYLEEKQPATALLFDDARSQIEAAYTALMRSAVVSDLVREAFEKQKVMIDKAAIEKMFNQK